MGNRKLPIDRGLLYELYINRELSTCEIAKEFRVNEVTIYNRLREFKIPIRPRAVAIKKAVNKPHELERRSRFSKAFYANPENKERLRQRMLKENPMSIPEVRDKHRQKVREAMANPDVRKRMSASLKIALNRPEVLAKKSKAAREYMNRPEVKEWRRINNPMKRVEVRMKSSEARKGEKNCNWKGGITPERQRIRNSIEYRLWQEAVFARDNWTCQKCGQRGGYLQPHHILNFAEHKELRFAIDNGITFCKSCHKAFHRLYNNRRNTREQVEAFLRGLKVIVGGANG